jgi:hypothetical protein
MIVSGDITFTWFTSPIGTQYQGLRFVWEGQPYLIENLNRRFLAFQNHHSIFILPLTNDIVSPLKNHFTSCFVTYPWSSKYQDEGAAGGCNNHCVFGSETMSTKNNGDFQWGLAVTTQFTMVQCYNGFSW